MKRFEDALEVSPLDDGVNWVAVEAFYYDTDVPIPGKRIVCEAGFISDFASIPRILWTLVGAPAEGKYRKAAFLHDKLYRTRGLATRRMADAVLFEAMTVSGTNWLTRWEIYLGVRLGGHSSYKGGL